MELGQQIGRKIRTLRERRGLTQSQLASLLGKSGETISNFERGKVVTSIQTLDQMAKVLNVRLMDFFDGVAVGAADRQHRAERARSSHAQTVRNAADLLPEEDLEILAGLATLLESRRRREGGKGE
ncbi:XRE family transcriptional regulator [Rhodospirillum rubrum]|uniref:Transcriptional regulator, XRE family n=2 Tax=Rhodospirillum rubrum TaxID=1085 RepID=Q2RP07_RHORT|nr:helix-turn-helix transcriptional regulator [Rhodospirillum rubrum]ABC24138.1 transcriptional regulator, XRE family [Rhodospirillum rubrum ATCC 11170]MBK1664522.1 XRE family transcriptional regulator [Rhodospirillum rubrum]MBK1676223.1 XRE family transcriptional regulator [Rhodospirillum rubrum]MBK5955852.1 transcriptional regulator [Rhodospirillum rubrum]QXG80081.1 helix-turn-helix domain-containing protein [Rhodospirillum rubrum]